MVDSRIRSALLLAPDSDMNRELMTTYADRPPRPRTPPWAAFGRARCLLEFTIFELSQLETRQEQLR